MTAGLFNTGLSALFASQTGLNTAGHNIANANSPGYTRQRVVFETRPPQFNGVGFIGKGVDIQTIERLSNEFLTEQLRVATANEARAAKYAQLMDHVDLQIGGGLIADGIDNFFASVGDANDNPRMMATRQVVLENARALVSRFFEQSQQLGAMSESLNRQVAGQVDEINALTSAIALVNRDISRGAGAAGGAAPNDLLDRRDRLITELSALVDTQVQNRDDNMVNVVIGDGQLVVTGTTHSSLGVQSNTLDPSRTDVVYTAASGSSVVTSALHGGELGALLEFRDNVLDSTRNSIGRIAATLAVEMNEQHRQGMDLNGVLGGDLFSIPQPKVNAPAANTGTISVAFDTANIDQLSVSDYYMRHDGANFILTNTLDGTTQTLAGAGPFSVDGMTITVTSAPAAGDEYLIMPTREIPRTMSLLINDPATLALASPVRSSAAFANVSDADITRPEILDSTDANLLVTTQIVFNDPPSTYQLNGAGPLLPFTAGADIDVNGWRVQINGVPEAGDTFVVENNAGGSGDNSNGLSLGQMQFSQLMEGGTATFQEAYGILVGEVGSLTSQSRVSHEALVLLAENAQATRDSYSAVNLDEEAADMLRFQHLYQAAAQIIVAADTTFRALLDATGN